ncbi:YDG/SRA domain-containing protein [Colletotrichum tofieldiae]|uniref:YDG/SRA domain-containing protein n=1 Tax=Colletotrichum tofieldiae TaxID=708197 RepID=A0A166X895_9PEZI|nr:YDG/SRA domain-containing protein [Colletotrichum tofieldiae]GKT61621.1 YDG/SRA domain-containing protein [Colletotrichum tofieldiae]GKT70322.1 YDG/SRA domain-containing protein [Colletotrichum tofieldiae]GKT93380.1 YDG/SRA domain-containing protein [Colletotrichum tofieldiae]
MSEEISCSTEKPAKRCAGDKIDLPAKRSYETHLIESADELKTQNSVQTHDKTVAESCSSNAQMSDSSDHKSNSGFAKHDAKTIKIPVVTDVAGYVEHIRHKVVGTIGILAKRSKPNSIPRSELLDRLDQFLNWLETRSWGPETLAPQTRKTLESCLRFLWEPTQADLQIYFSATQKTRAKALSSTWADSNASLFVDDDENAIMLADATDEAESTKKNKSIKKSTKDPGAKTEEFRLPPLNHPIFGAEGPMRGIAYIQGKTKSYTNNPEMANLKKSSHAFGHNGIEAGEWWPMQAAAVFNGAHGTWQGGISGHAGEGAYSIVISGAYESCDADYGTTLHYSGSGAHTHTGQAPQNKDGTKLLHLSLKKGNPVRVLRSASGKGGVFRPSHGIRYDGLYQVTKVRILTNKKGGAYYQFELERLPEQRGLDELLVIPDAIQQAQWWAVKEGY